MHRTSPRWLLAAVLVVAALAAAPAAQSGATVSDRVRDAMLAQEVGWQLEWSDVQEHQFSHRWVHGEERILVTYDELASEADATAWLDAVPSRVSTGGSPLAGVGDQAYIFSYYAESGTASVYLRKGKGTALLSAPSANIATRIAQLVAAQIY